MGSIEPENIMQIEVRLLFINKGDTTPHKYNKWDDDSLKSPY